MLAPTLGGHAGGPPIEREISNTALADAVERAMDAVGFETAHIVGNSLGGYVALQLAARGRADTVVALAPAGGWAQGDDSYRETLGLQAAMLDMLKAAAPHADTVLATPQGRRRATQLVARNFEHIPTELLAHQMLAAATSPAALALMDHASCRAGASTRSGSRAPSESCGEPSTGSCPGRRPPPAFVTTGSPTPTGSSWRVSVTARSSTSRSKPPS